MKSSNFAVDKHTSFSTYHTHTSSSSTSRSRSYLGKIGSSVYRRRAVDTSDEHENGVEELEGDGGLLEVVGVDAGQDGHEQWQDIGLTLREMRRLSHDLSRHASETSDHCRKPMWFSDAVDRRKEPRNVFEA